MEKKAYFLALVVIIGVLIGVTIVVNQTREPLLRQILQNQQAMVEKGTAGSKDAMDGGSDLEQRIVLLETQMKGIQDMIKQARAPQQAPEQPDTNTVYTIPVDHTPVIGKKNAPVTITEFLDIQCPFCARFHPAIVEVMKAYPDKVNLLTKFFPLSFHPQARPASKAALAAAEQGKFEEMVDALLQNAQNLTEETFKKLAGDLGLNVDKFMKDYKDNDQAYDALIEKDIALGGQVGVRGTPSFYINGRQTFARDLPAWKAEVEKELNK